MLQAVGGNYRRKIKTVDELCDVIGARPRAKKVIMCHGVFDLVHPGHIRHLLYAIEAIASLHLAKEEEQYFPLLDQLLSSDGADDLIRDVLAAMDADADIA